MTRQRPKLLAMALTACLVLAAIAGCCAAASATAPQEIITIDTIYPGDEPRGMEAVLAAINEKMGADIGVNLRITWVPMDQYDNKITLAIQAGEKLDFIWRGSSNMVAFANDKLIMPIDEPMAKYGQPIYDNIDNKLFDSMKIDGKLMGIPSTGNGPLVSIYHNLIYREDLRLKHDLPKLDSMDSIELYLRTIKEQEPSIVPVMGTDITYAIWLAFGPEDGIAGTNGMVQATINSDGTVTCVPIYEAKSFLGGAAKVREWYQAGYIPQDILNTGGDATNRLRAGVCAMITGGALSASEQQAAVSAQVPGARLSEAPVFDSVKYIAGNGGNALYVTSTSKLADQCVQFWSWVLTSQENFDLYCYGVEGVNYEIVNDRVVYMDDSYVTFPAWMFKNMNYLRFSEDVTDEYIESIAHWNDGAQISPLMGFSFSTKDVAAEYTACNSVKSAYNPTFGTGTAEVEPLMKEYIEKLKAAGIEQVVAECQAQVDAFLAAQK